MSIQVRRAGSGTKEQGLLDPLLSEFVQDPDFVAEGLALRVMNEAALMMEGQGINRAELAKIMGVSRAHVTRMFNAPSNMTLRSIAALALALGVEPSVGLDK